MYKSYSIRSDLDNFLKSKGKDHDTLIKTLFGKSKKVNTKTDVLTWLSDNPKDIELFKNWMRNNDGKPILDKISSIASESTYSKENKEDQKLYQAWSITPAMVVAADIQIGTTIGATFATEESIIPEENMVATDDISKELKDFKQFVTERFESQDKEIKNLRRLDADQGKTIVELQREVQKEKLEVKLLTQKLKQMEQKLESANADKNKLKEELREERREKIRMANKFLEMEKKIKAVIDENAKLEEALRAETEHNVISETGKTSEEEVNAQALNAKALEEAFKAKKAILLQLSADCKEIHEMYLTDRCCSPCSDYMMSSDDAANYISPSHDV